MITVKTKKEFAAFNDEDTFRIDTNRIMYYHKKKTVKYASGGSYMEYQLVINCKHILKYSDEKVFNKDFKDLDKFFLTERSYDK